MRGPKFTLGAVRPPARPLVEKLSYLKRVLGPVEMCEKFDFLDSSSSSFRDMRGSQIYTRRHCVPRGPPSGKKILIPEKEFLAPSKCL